MVAIVYPVDERLPAAKLLPLAIQHVLVMYAGAAAVPLIIGRAVNLPPERRPVQRRPVRLWPGNDCAEPGFSGCWHPIAGDDEGHIRLDRSDAAMAASPEIGLPGIYGAVIGAGIFGVVVAPFVSRLLPMFPPVVTGTIILVIGVSLMRMGINWAGGGLQTFAKVVDGVPAAVPNPAFGQLTGLAIALLVLTGCRQPGGGAPRAAATDAAAEHV
jgi:uric acid transporter